MIKSDKSIFGKNTAIFVFQIDYLEKYPMNSAEIWYTYSNNQLTNSQKI